MDKIILLDSGHGGIINGKYQTAPSKMFNHKDGTLALEGVINRKVKGILMKMLYDDGIRFIDVCPSELDVPLSTRCKVINTYCDTYGKENCLLISLHSNAGNGNGFEIWTTPAKDKSDEYAMLFVEEFIRWFPKTIIRKDLTDNDPDKESLFYILANTKCPSILPEWLFFDNFNDWVYMREEHNQEMYASMIRSFIRSIK
jgi:N-acetylmuramoyl-L-alanine amidase